jgi:geranylgeranyl pyrophosphate synthase
VSAGEQITPVPDASPADGVWSLPELIGVTEEIDRMRAYLSEWIESSHEEVREMLAYQLDARAKYFRPVAAFACHRAAYGRPATEDVIRAAAAVEMFHNYTLVIDDIVDRDRYRRGRLALHCRYGSLPGLAVGAYLAFGAAESVASDPYLWSVFDDLGKRIVVAECRQWRLRRRALSVDEWRRIAGEDTGALFETCARVSVRDGRLDRYAYLLGTLYHGCDDVADVRGTTALGGGSEKDIIDGILTLPAAIAVRDPVTAALFRAGERSELGRIAERLQAALPEAEGYLDRLADEAVAEAAKNADDPRPLIDLVGHTRTLSRI